VARSRSATSFCDRQVGADASVRSALRHSSGTCRPSAISRPSGTSISGAGVHVGIYDTGVESDHPDLAGNYDASRNLVFNTETESGEVNPPYRPTHDLAGNGTAVAGIIGAERNGVGGVGIAWGSSLTSVNINDTTKSYDFQTGNAIDFATAIRWSIGHFDVTNNSWNSLPIYDRMRG